MNRLAATQDIQTIQSIGAVSTIMKVINEITRLRFVCVARVTSDSWTACAVLDQLNLGLKPGDELDIRMTLCEKVRTTSTPVIIDDISQDLLYCDHPIPQMYGFKSYFSVPIYHSGGEFFGTLCGLDPVPAELKTPKIQDMLTLFTELISLQLESEKKLKSAETALRDELESAELREQFIAILGHDLRTPLSSIILVADSLKHNPEKDKVVTAMSHIGLCAKRISAMIDNVMDFTQGRMGRGLSVKLEETTALAQKLRHVVAELKSTYKDRKIYADINFDRKIKCDPERLAQLLSNLLTNALTHGDATQPIIISASCARNRLVLSVSNVGPPIPNKISSRLFQPFWRGSNNDSSKGLGLGLYIASEIARSHNGTLKVTSTPVLTTFTFSTALTAMVSEVKPEPRLKNTHTPMPVVCERRSVLPL